MEQNLNGVKLSLNMKRLSNGTVMVCKAIITVVDVKTVAAAK